MKQTATHKYCKPCDTWKLKSEFNQHQTRYDGLQAYCMKCQQDRNRSRRRTVKKRNDLIGLNQGNYAGAFNPFNIIPPVTDKLVVPSGHKPGIRVRVNADGAW